MTRARCEFCNAPWGDRDTGYSCHITFTCGGIGQKPGEQTCLHELCRCGQVYYGGTKSPDPLGIKSYCDCSAPEPAPRCRLSKYSTK